MAHTSSFTEAFEELLNKEMAKIYADLWQGLMLQVTRWDWNKGGLVDENGERVVGEPTVTPDDNGTITDHVRILCPEIGCNHLKWADLACFNPDCPSKTSSSRK